MKRLFTFLIAAILAFASSIYLSLAEITPKPQAHAARLAGDMDQKSAFQDMSGEKHLEAMWSV